MAPMSGQPTDNPLQKGIKSWQDPLLIDEWNSERAKRVPKPSPFEEIVDVSVEPPTGGGEEKKRDRDDKSDVAPASKKARMARASKGNAKGNASKVSIDRDYDPSTGTKYDVWKRRWRRRAVN